MRRYHFWLLAAGVVLGTDARSRAQPPDATRFAQKENATLAEILTAGLKVRTGSERAFINRIAAKVDEGKLSEALVKAVFQRARQQHARYPLPYFTVMIKKAALSENVVL
jgi:hypothetical protein